MIYLAIFALLLFAILVYFRVAHRYNIIDKPNHRSSHTAITIRGGGILFYFGALIYFIWSGFQYPYFFCGLTLMALISFLDDMYTLSNKLRIIIHLIAVFLLFFEVGLFSLPLWVIPLALVVTIGIVNAYNFMDGINGITTIYSFAVLWLLWLVNRELAFIDERLLYCTGIANAVFAFFNYRQRAKCFAGDVGSVSMAFLLVFMLAMLIKTSGNFVYLLFLTVYGVDTGWTILQRIRKKENIFEAHRSHLYQYLANEAGINKLVVAASYGLLQLSIGLMVVYITNYGITVQIISSVIILLLMSFIYLYIKNNIEKKLL
ncbi:glycosyltransferase family 4 protein [Olivibacter sp. SDN3]|uniref:MraY family glycosyltransferase n=1 Tax=Olivibacter sp. SDN3 TaxID=2764720 RepID=UPI0016510BB3|nr:glycosyltransferase family 4 protein [Olivibacter sp. SDN3]QNL51605.1 glycosyltransferase family 4 protein [Olivibacter sp. SDN3]